MAEIILPTLPTAGGTLQVAVGQADICRLTETRYFSIFGQSGSGADLTFGAVYTIANPYVTTPTAVINRQQVIQDFSSRYTLGYMQCWRLDDTHVLVGFNSTSGATNSLSFNVISIDPVTNVMAKQLTSDLVMPGPTVYWSSATYNRMQALGECQADNNFVFVSMDNTYAVHIDRLVYNSGANTLTRTRVLTGITGTNNDCYSAYISKIPGSNKLCISLRYDYGVSSYNTQTTKIVYTLGPADNAVTTLISSAVCNPISAKTFIPLSETSGVFLYDSRVSRYWDTTIGVYGTTVANGVNGTSTYIPIEGYALSDSYYVIVTGLSANPSTRQNAGASVFRVVKFTDKNLSQVSTGTAAANGLQVSSVVAFKNVERLSTSNLVTISTVKDASSFMVKTLWF